MGQVIAAGEVPEDVLNRIREHPCPVRHEPDGYWREPGEPCYRDPAADDLERYERAWRRGQITRRELDEAVAVAEYLLPPTDERPPPVPAIPPGSLGDSPGALETEWPGWAVRETGDGLEASCPAKTVRGRTPKALRLAIEKAIGVPVF